MHDVVARRDGRAADGADAGSSAPRTRSRDAVRQVAHTGRVALTDMQRVLRALGPPGDNETEPTDVGLSTLVERFGAAGLPVTATDSTPRCPTTRRCALAVLRILGEALTNVLRHAPGASSVEVVVRRTPTAVEVEVVDSGGTRPGTGGSGRGIVGMGERVALFGGHVSAGPRPVGGW